MERTFLYKNQLKDACYPYIKLPDELKNMREEKIILNFDHGKAKAGEVFVRGDLLHGVPTYYSETDNDPTNWYWAEDSKKEENRFLRFNCINLTSKNN